MGGLEVEVVYGDDQFKPARQVQIAEHGGDQHREWHDALGQERHAIERDLGDVERRDVLDVAGAPEHFDEINQRDQHQQAGEYGRGRTEEAQSEIGREQPKSQMQRTHGRE